MKDSVVDKLKSPPIGYSQVSSSEFNAMHDDGLEMGSFVSASPQGEDDVV